MLVVCAASTWISRPSLRIASMLVPSDCATMRATGGTELPAGFMMTRRFLSASAFSSVSLPVLLM